MRRGELSYAECEHITARAENGGKKVTSYLILFALPFAPQQTPISCFCPTCLLKFLHLQLFFPVPESVNPASHLSIFTVHFNEDIESFLLITWIPVFGKLVGSSKPSVSFLSFVIRPLATVKTRYGFGVFPCRPVSWASVGRCLPAQKKVQLHYLYRRKKKTCLYRCIALATSSIDFCSGWITVLRC